ncbi:MAG: hypothetical protein JSW34_03905 [Candidatus Zixiibacteriota bacterium]|nr:MAG: hypothetical protein JSW34_03905 [candidate division Zixibacteria bacterium]
MTIIRLLCVIILLEGLLFSAACADTGDRAKRGHKNPLISDIKLNLMGFFTTGLVAGEAAKIIAEYGNNVTDKMLFGGGVSLVSHPKPWYAFGLNLQYAYKSLPIPGISSSRGWLASASLMVFAQKQVKAIPYLRLDGGFVTGKYPDYDGDTDLKLGTHPLVRFGGGIFTFASSKFNTRLEVYYAIVFSSEHVMDQLGGSEIGFNGECVGLELAIGIPLMKR